MNAQFFFHLFLLYNNRGLKTLQNKQGQGHFEIPNYCSKICYPCCWVLAEQNENMGVCTFWTPLWKIFMHLPTWIFYILCRTDRGIGGIVELILNFVLNMWNIQKYYIKLLSILFSGLQPQPCYMWGIESGVEPFNLDYFWVKWHFRLKNSVYRNNTAN